MSSRRIIASFGVGGGCLTAYRAVKHLQQDCDGKQIEVEKVFRLTEQGGENISSIPLV